MDCIVHWVSKNWTYLSNFDFHLWVFLDGSVAEESAWRFFMQEMQEIRVQSLSWEDALECGNPLQYSCLGNPMDREAWWTTGGGVEKSQTELSMDTHDM